MKIGINLLWYLPDNGGGGATYVRGLLPALNEIDSHNEYILFTNRNNNDGFHGLKDNFRRVSCNFSAERRPLRLIREQLLLPYLARRERLDVLHCPSNSVPLIAQCPTVMTLHDLNFFAVPESFKNPLERHVAQILVMRSVRRADAIITVSEFCRNEVNRDLLMDPDRIFVAHNASRPRSELNLNSSHWEPLAKRLGLTRDYIVSIMSVSRHKNCVRLIRAFAQSDLPRSGALLVMIGLSPRGLALDAIAAELGVADSVIFTGFLPDSELPQLLAHARMMAFPSYYEGFGIPVLEAMEAGLPIACSSAAALPEIAGDAALFFDPFSVEQITAALTRLWNDESLRHHLVAAGRENAKRFSWKNSARKTLEVYQRVNKGTSH